MIVRHLFVLYLLTVCLCQSCNETNCSGYCISTINKCATQIGANGTNFTITQTPSYYYFEPEYDSYAKVMITLCGSNLPDVVNILNAKVEKQQGDYPNADNSKSVEFRATDLCLTYYGTELKFDKLSNGQRKKLLFSLFTSTAASEQMLGFVTGEHSILNNLLVTLFATVVAVIALLFLGVPIMYLRRRCLRNKLRNQLQDVSHIDKYMPTKKLGDNEQGAPCAVCLADIAKGEEFRSTPCNHVFHKVCIDDWCKKSMTCPNCRQDLSKKTLQEKNKKPARTWFGNNLRNVLVEEAASI